MGRRQHQGDVTHYLPAQAACRGLCKCENANTQNLRRGPERVDFFDAHHALLPARLIVRHGHEGKAHAQAAGHHLLVVVFCLFSSSPGTEVGAIFVL